MSPGKFGIAAISPPLDAAGNSVRAQKAIADVSNALGGNPYAVEAGREEVATGADAIARGAPRRPPGGAMQGSPVPGGGE